MLKLLSNGMIRLCSYVGFFVTDPHDKKQIGQWHAMELMTQIRGKILGQG